METCIILVSKIRLGSRRSRAEVRFGSQEKTVRCAIIDLLLLFFLFLFSEGNASCAFFINITFIDCYLTSQVQFLISPEISSCFRLNLIVARSTTKFIYLFLYILNPFLPFFFCQVLLNRFLSKIYIYVYVYVFLSPLATSIVRPTPERNVRIFQRSRNS